jgi:hypothetical protein
MDHTVKQILLRHPLRIGVASAILAGGVLGGAVAFADTPTTSPAPTPSTATPSPAAPSTPAPAQGAKPAKPAKHPHPHVIGKVTNVSPTGGLSNQGTITVVEPNGHQTTFSVTSSTNAVKYQGQGQKAVKETATSIPTNEVIEAGLRHQKGGVAARRIVDTGFKAG